MFNMCILMLIMAARETQKRVKEKIWAADMKS